MELARLILKKLTVMARRSFLSLTEKVGRVAVITVALVAGAQTLALAAYALPGINKLVRKREITKISFDICT